MMDNTSSPSASPSPTGGIEFRATRILPGIFIVVLQWVLRFGVPFVTTAPSAMMISYLGGLLGGVALVIWWAFFRPGA